MATIAGIPSHLFNAYIIENEYFGRKKTIIFSLLGQALSIALTGALYENAGLIVSSTVVVFFSSIGFCTLVPYTCEIYETEIRGVAMGFVNAMGRIGGAVAPIILIYLHQISTGVPHYFMAVLSFIAFGVACTLPVETRGRQLDKAVV
jgi:MFS family permease